MDRSGIITLGRTSVKLRENVPKEQEQTLDILQRDALTVQKQTMQSAPNKARDAVNKYLKEYLEDENIDKKSAEYKSTKSMDELRETSPSYKKIIGLLSLLYAYNAQFQLIAVTPAANANAKNAMPVMSRTSLFDAYRTLGDVERKIFEGICQNARDEIAAAAEDAKEVSGWLRVPSELAHPLAEQFILAGQHPDESKPWNALSLQNWMRGLLNNKDEMYDHDFDSVGKITDRNGKKPMRIGPGLA